MKHNFQVKSLNFNPSSEPDIDSAELLLKSGEKSIYNWWKIQAHLNITPQNEDT